MQPVNKINIDRLNLLIEQYGSQAKLATVIGKPPAQLSQWLNGHRNISSSTKSDIESKLSLPSGWLDQPIRMQDSKTSEINAQSEAKVVGSVTTWDDDTPLDDDEFEAPFYKEIRLSAGNGFADDIADYNPRKLRFSSSTLRKKGICPTDVICVTTDGDSMSPVFPDGATLGIDMGSKSIKDGQIYAINHDGLLRTKILKKRPGNRILIQSYNSEEYPDEEVDMAEISVIGRIFWWSVLI